MIDRLSAPELPRASLPVPLPAAALQCGQLPVCAWCAARFYDAEGLVPHAVCLTCRLPVFGTRAGLPPFGVQLAPAVGESVLAAEVAADSRLLHFLLLLERDAIRTQARVLPRWI